MKLITYNRYGREQLALLAGHKCYDLDELDPRLPDTMNEFLVDWEIYIERLAICENQVKEGFHRQAAKNYNDLELLAPVPHPGSCRDGYAFRQHVAVARRNRNATMLPEFDEYPVFYFTNHRTVKGPGNIYC